jgi:hypothetical protein
MRRISLVICLAAFASACSYSHVGPANATFNQPGPPLGGPLVLKISRHVDTIVHGPDDEEDQLLTLEVRDVRLNQRLVIPSENVKAEFTATRFGPRSQGDSFSGYLIVRKITADEVDAYLHLDIAARTKSGSYKQTAKFHGNFSFTCRAPDNDSVP